MVRTDLGAPAGVWVAAPGTLAVLAIDHRVAEPHAAQLREQHDVPADAVTVDAERLDQVATLLAERARRPPRRRSR